MSKNSNSKEKDHSKFKWFIEVFILTFVLSICFSYISTNGVTNLNLPLSILILVAVIGVGIIFDIIGVAVTVANEEEFHAKATKKVKGSKDSIKLHNTFVFPAYRFLVSKIDSINLLGQIYNFTLS